MIVQIFRKIYYSPFRFSLSAGFICIGCCICKEKQVNINLYILKASMKGRNCFKWYGLSVVFAFQQNKIERFMERNPLLNLYKWTKWTSFHATLLIRCHYPSPRRKSKEVNGCHLLSKFALKQNPMFSNQPPTGTILLNRKVMRHGHQNDLQLHCWQEKKTFCSTSIRSRNIIRVWPFGSVGNTGVRLCKSPMSAIQFPTGPHGSPVPHKADL